jgi:uncharacterized protein YjeT (DUF2065 family)
MKLLFLLIGVVLVLEGLPYAAAPDIMRGWLEKVSRMEPHSLRLIGIASVVSGLGLCWLVTRLF